MIPGAKSMKCQCFWWFSGSRGPKVAKQPGLWRSPIPIPTTFCKAHPAPRWTPGLRLRTGGGDVMKLEKFCWYWKSGIFKNSFVWPLSGPGTPNITKNIKISSLLHLESSNKYENLADFEHFWVPNLQFLKTNEFLWTNPLKLPKMPPRSSAEPILPPFQRIWASIPPFDTEIHEEVD